MKMLIVTLLWMTSSAEAQKLPTEMTKVWQIGELRMKKYGIKKQKRLDILSGLSKAAKKHSVSIDDQLIILAMMEIESHFKDKARSHKGAKGLLQLTSAAIIDAKAFCGIKRRTKVYRVDDNIELGVCYKLWLEDAIGSKDRVKMLIGYNGGYGHVVRYEKSLDIPCETANYVLKVQRLKKEFNETK